MKISELQVVIDKLKHHHLVSNRQLNSSEGLCTYAAVYVDKEQGFNMRLVNEIPQLSLGKKNLLTLISLGLNLRRVREPALAMPVRFPL